MTATGIVRRIDDLGRIVVPKEIRKILRIREGDPLEIFTSRTGEILLKKYSPIGELKDFAESYAQSLATTTGGLVCITDRDYIVAAAGPKKKDFDGKPLSKELELLIEKRGVMQANIPDASFIKITPDDPGEFAAEAIATILSNGDCIGSVVLYGKSIEKWHAETAVQLVQTAAQFLGKQME
jgi:AbrB family transcriptional regulator (stage V sporulation protein T)